MTPNVRRLTASGTERRDLPGPLSQAGSSTSASRRIAVGDRFEIAHSRSTPHGGWIFLENLSERPTNIGPHALALRASAPLPRLRMPGRQVKSPRDLRKTRRAGGKFPAPTVTPALHSPLTANGSSRPDAPRFPVLRSSSGGTGEEIAESNLPVGNGRSSAGFTKGDGSSDRANRSHETGDSPWPLARTISPSVPGPLETTRTVLRCSRPLPVSTGRPPRRCGDRWSPRPEPPGWRAEAPDS